MGEAVAASISSDRPAASAAAATTIAATAPPAAKARPGSHSGHGPVARVV